MSIDKGNIKAIIKDGITYSLTDYEFAINSDNKRLQNKLLEIEATGEKFSIGEQVLNSRNQSITALVIGEDRDDCLEKCSDLKALFQGAGLYIVNDRDLVMKGYFSNINHGFYRGKFQGRTAIINMTFISQSPFWEEQATTELNITGITPSIDHIDISNSGNASAEPVVTITVKAPGTLKAEIMGSFFSFNNDLTVALNDVIVITGNDYTVIKNGNISLIGDASDDFFLNRLILEPGINVIPIETVIEIDVKFEFIERFE